MNEPLQQPTGGTSEIRTTTHTVPWKIICVASVLVTALLAGGGIYLWQRNVKNTAVNNVKAQLAALQNTQATQNDSGAIATAAANEQIKKLQYDLLAEKVKFEISRSYYGATAFQDPKNSTVFYYAYAGGQTPKGDTYFISRYDASKDAYYAKTGVFDISANSTRLYEETLGLVDAEGSGAFLKMYLDPLNLIDNQLVFHYMAQDDSPGPCWTAWTDRQLFAVDITQTPPLKRTPFVISESLKTEKQKEYDQCRREVEAGIGIESKN